MEVTSEDFEGSEDATRNRICPVSYLILAILDWPAIELFVPCHVFA